MRGSATIAWVNGREDGGGRRWGLLIAVLSGAAWGSLGYVGFEWLMRSGTCYDIQGDPDTQRACDAYSARIATGSRVVLAVAVLSAVTRLPVGFADGVRGPVRPVWWLAAGNPVALAGYLAGWLAGRLTRSGRWRGSAAR